MKLQVLKGQTSKLLQIFIQDSSSGVGAGLTGLVFNSASLTAYYYREGAGSAVQIVLATMTLGTWATGGFIVVDGTNLPGVYQLGIPDAALASGANSVIVMLKGATNMAPLLLEIQLQNMDPYDGVRAGLTALPNVASGSAGAIPTTGAGANQISVSSGLVDITQTAADKVWASTTRTLSAFSTALALSVWDVLASAVATASSIGLQLKTNVDAAVTSRLAPTVAARTLDVAATGEAGLDFDNIKDATGAHTLTNIRVPNVTLTDTVTTYTGNTLQTGDSFARLGAPVGVSISADVAGVQADTDNIQTRLPAALVTGRMDATIGAYQSGLTPLQPTVAGRTLDVTATGEAGIDWNNIGAPSTSQVLSGTSIAQVTGAVGSVTGNVGGSVGSVTGSVGGNVTGSVGSVAGGVAGNVVGSVGSLAIPAQTDVKNMVISAIAGDTYAEPASVPAASTNLAAKIGWLYTKSRNKITETATTQLIRDDGDAATIGTATVSDDGVNAIRTKYI